MCSNIDSRKGDEIMTENELFILTAIYEKWSDETFKKCSVDFQTQKRILQSLEKKGLYKKWILHISGLMGNNSCRTKSIIVMQK